MPCLGVNLHLELKNATTHSQMTQSSQIYDLKSAGDQMVSTTIHLKYAVFYFSYPLCFLQVSYPLNVKYKQTLSKTNFTQIWLIKINKNIYDQC